MSDKSDGNWKNKAAVAVGSAAVAAALLWVKRRNDKANKPAAAPLRFLDPPETD